MDYQKHYDNLINLAKTRKLDSYKESHHIVPRCMGGSDESDNLVDLSAREHYLAHQLLVKIYPHQHGLIKACRMMCISSRGQIRNNREYEWIRKKINSLPGSMTGRKHSAETRQKMSQSAKGKQKSQSHRKALSVAFTGVTYITDSGREKIRQTHLNKNVSNETRQAMSKSIKKINIDVTCPWCGKTGKLTGMKSWHFDRCKENPNGLQRSVCTK